jgi:hypothetical protein
LPDTGTATARREAINSNVQLQPWPFMPKPKHDSRKLAIRSFQDRVGTLLDARLGIASRFYAQLAAGVQAQHAFHAKVLCVGDVMCVGVAASFL